jgi:hypothetical protein
MPTPTGPAAEHQNTDPAQLSTASLADIRLLIAQLPDDEPITDEDLASLGLTSADLARLDAADEQARHAAELAEIDDGHEDEREDATEITVLVQAEVDLSSLRRYAVSEDGRLISISYQHEDYYPHFSGVVLHFELPNGRVVVTYPDPDGFTLLWREDMTPADDVPDGASDVLHAMWDQVNAAIETTLRQRFGSNAAEAIVTALSEGATR